MRVIIATVGTSLLANHAKGSKEDPTASALANYLRHTAADTASAETNSLGKLLKSGDGIVFLHSSTGEGALCADSLARHFSAMGYESRVSDIPDLSWQESRFKMLGLRALVVRIIEIINAERKKGNEVAINATGGFKAQIAYATLIGLLFDVPVYYMHEKFQEIIEMPPVPIAWDFSLFIYYDDFIEWLDRDLRTKAEVEPKLKALPSELKFLLAEEDGYFILSAAGEVFYEACRAREANFADVPILLSAKARNTLDAANLEDRAALLKYIGKMRDVFSRRNQSKQKNNSDCLVFPSGHVSQRIFYYENEDGLVHVCDLAPNHDQYVRMLDKKGVWRRDFGDFAKL
jgi:putative CRISPR-associated protein (TIGR02619 family)